MSGSSRNVCIHDAARGPTFGTTIPTLSIGRNKWGIHLRHNPDGSKVAMSTESGTIYVFDTQNEALVSTSVSHAMCVPLATTTTVYPNTFTSTLTVANSDL